MTQLHVNEKPTDVCMIKSCDETLVLMSLCLFSTNSIYDKTHKVST